MRRGRKSLARDLGLVGELFRDKLVGKDRMVDSRSGPETRRHSGEDPLLGQAGLGSLATVRLRKSI